MSRANITLLEVMVDNDGEYEFPFTISFGTKSEAIAAAWRMHDNFLGTEDSEDFRDDECLNVHEDDFVDGLTNYNMVVTANEDMTVRRVYRLIPIDVEVKPYSDFSTNC